MRIQFSLISFFAIAVVSVSCNQNNVSDKQGDVPVLFKLMNNTGISFSNDIQNTKDFNIFSYRNFYNGGGVAIGDINNDGLADVFFTANMGSNKLYLNKGNFQFEDITDKAGVSQTDRWNTGVVMVDINNDGWLDIYVCNAGINKWRQKQGNALFINNRDLTFTDKAKECGLDNNGYTTHAAFFDYDLDGDLDCYILNNSFIPVNTLNYSNKRELRAKDWPIEDFLKGGGSYLMRNDNGKFTDVSEQAGIYGSLISFGLGVTVGDVNGDHYPDIYVSNDFFERDYLYINQQNGIFKEELEKWTQHISMSSMGADLSDVNNDGYPDLFVTDMLPDDDYRLKTTSSFEDINVFRLKEKQGFYHQYMQNTLQVNNKNGRFVETGFYSGVAASDWSWGGLIFDADNDGFSDIYVCNGIYHDVTDQDFIDFFANEVIQRMVMTGEKEQVNEIIGKMPSSPVPNKMFRNLGNLKFTDNGEAWGLSQPSFSNGAAYGDLDNDGDLDLVVNNVNAEAFVYKNNSREINKNNYIGILLQGGGQNTFAAGSTVKIYQDSQVISREVIPARGFQSSVDYKVIAGLGNGAADSVAIIWPDRSYTIINKPEINKVHLIKQDEAKKVPMVLTAKTQAAILQNIKTVFEKHHENDFIDYNGERNIPMMVSKEGPKAAYADVNGDKLIDIYIGGAANQAGQLYLQTNTGFVKKKSGEFERDSVFEDVATLFFDCDKDGDPDLYIGAGGNNHPPNTRELQHRLYKNDGKGNFTLTPDAFPANSMNISVAVAYDFDKDGDEDIFVGGRSTPYNYGLNTVSYLFVNDGKGKFTDIAKTVNPDISGIGLVTGAVWANVTGDTQKELIITGEWMYPRIFTYTNNRFEEIKTNLAGMYGWWQTVTAADVDADGDQDIILGNIGENFYLQPDSAKPVKMYINDFDRNGNIEKIITRTVNGKDVPVFLKRDLTDQVVSLKKQNLRYTEFARKSVQELFTEEAMKNSNIKVFNYSSTCIAYNEGNGRFTIRKLPAEVQYSSVNAILCKDLNGDNKIDLVLGGNKFGFLPQFSRLDASFGHVLINDGKGNFICMPAASSGLEIRGEIKDIIELPGRKTNHLLFLVNNDYPQLYRLNNTKAVK